jgi:hypothetical protein
VRLAEIEGSQINFLQVRAYEIKTPTCVPFGRNAELRSATDDRKRGLNIDTRRHRDPLHFPRLRPTLSPHNAIPVAAALAPE